MDKTVVDSKRRIVLPRSRPGDIYVVEAQGEGRLLLVRMGRKNTPPETSSTMDRDSCLKAIHETPLTNEMTWEQLRKATRDL